MKSDEKKNDLRLVNVLVSGLSPQNVTWFSSVIPNTATVAAVGTGDGSAGDVQHQVENTGTGVKATFLTNHEGDTGLYDRSKNFWYMNWSHSDDKGRVYGGKKAELVTDNEGGTLELISPDGTLGLQMDLFNNNVLRAYMFEPDPWKYLSDFGFNR